MNVHIFLDRDGTIIKDTGYISDPNKVVVLNGVMEGLALLKSRGFYLHIVSNQSGIPRGKISSGNFISVESQVKKIFLENGIEFDSVNYCFHLPSDNCACRKPSPGLIAKVVEELKIHKSHCGMIGNSKVDEGAANNFGIPFWCLTEDGMNFSDIAREVVKYFDNK